MAATTQELINTLAANVTPVRRLRPPMLRYAVWLAFAVLIVAMLGVSHGVRPGLAQRLEDPLFVLRVAAALTTGILAAAAAFLISVPDRSRRWSLLPLPAAVVWAATIGYGCLTDWISLTPGGIRPGGTLSCLATLVLTGTPLSLAMYVMTRRASPLRPVPVTLLGALAVAAVTATALSLFHALDATVLILAWNLGVAVLFMALAGMLGTRFGPSDPAG